MTVTGFDRFSMANCSCLSSKYNIMVCSPKLIWWKFHGVEFHEAPLKDSFVGLKAHVYFIPTISVVQEAYNTWKYLKYSLTIFCLQERRIQSFWRGGGLLICIICEILEVTREIPPLLVVQFN